MAQAARAVLPTGGAITVISQWIRWTTARSITRMSTTRPPPASTGALASGTSDLLSARRRKREQRISPSQLAREAHRFLTLQCQSMAGPTVQQFPLALTMRYSRRGRIAIRLPRPGLELKQATLPLAMVKP